MGKIHVASVRDALILLVLFTLGPAFALVIHTDAVERRMAVEDTRKGAVEQVRLQAGDLDRFLEGAHQLLSGISVVSRSGPDSADFTPILEDLLHRNPQYLELRLVRPDGSLVCRAPGAAAGGAATTPAVLKEVLRTREFTIGSPETDPRTGRTVLWLAHPVPGRHGQAGEAVMAALDLVRFSELRPTGIMPPGAVLLILDGAGRVVARVPDPGRAVGRQLADASLARRITSRVEGTVKAGGPDDVARLYAHRPLAVAPLYVAVGLPEKAAYSGANQLLVRNLVLLALVGVLALLAAWAIANALILRRLQALASVANRLSGGDLAARAAEGSLDEFGTVATAFNGMAERISEMLEREHRVGEELAERVNRMVGLRTRELEALGRVSDMLQASQSLDEAYAVLERMLGLLFPGTCGALYTFSGTHGLLEASATWGDFPEASRAAVFRAEDCWGLRRGRPYLVAAGSGDLPCPHVRPPLPPAYECLPLVAHGDTVGLLMVQAVPGALEALDPSGVPRQRQPAGVAEHLALSLANLRLRETLRSQSVRDPLTGLFNRRYMEETLERELRRAHRAQRPLSLIMIDIDHFKAVNDSFGHEAGDVALTSVARMLMDNLRGGDAACRVGGEEFLLILPEASLEDAARRAEMLCVEARGIRCPEGDHEQAAVNLGVSLGVAAFPRHGATAAEVLRAADGALYRAKREGRGRVAVAG